MRNGKGESGESQPQFGERRGQLELEWMARRVGRSRRWTSAPVTERGMTRRNGVHEQRTAHGQDLCVRAALAVQTVHRSVHDVAVNRVVPSSSTILVPRDFQLLFRLFVFPCPTGPVLRAPLFLFLPALLRPNARGLDRVIPQLCLHRLSLQHPQQAPPNAADPQSTATPSSPRSRSRRANPSDGGTSRSARTLVRP